MRSRLGHIVIIDCYAWASAILLPAFVVDWLIYPVAAAEFICVQMGLIILASFMARKEFQSRRTMVLIPLFPFYALLANVPRFAAMYRFVKGWVRRREDRLDPSSRPHLRKAGGYRPPMTPGFHPPLSILPDQ